MSSCLAMTPIRLFWPPIITTRTFHATGSLLAKKIVQETAGNKIVVQGVKVDSPRADYLAVPPKDANAEACPLCRLGLRRLAYSDVLILSQFVQPDGLVMPIHETGLCSKKYRLVKRLVRDAQLCKLLPRPADFEVYGPWDSLNTYKEHPKRYRDQPMRQIRPDHWQEHRGDVPDWGIDRQRFSGP